MWGGLKTPQICFTHEWECSKCFFTFTFTLSFLLGSQRWKKRQTLQKCLCYFSAPVLFFSTSAISINNAFSCYLQIFHSFIGHLLVLIFLGLFCICAILIAFSISVGSRNIYLEIVKTWLQRVKKWFKYQFIPMIEKVHILHWFYSFRTSVAAQSYQTCQSQMIFFVINRIYLAETNELIIRQHNLQGRA